MAKRKGCAQAAADPKQLKQALTAKNRGARQRAKPAGMDSMSGLKRTPVSKDIEEEEDKLERKVKPKRRPSAKPTMGHAPSTTSTITAAVKTSKHSQSPVKEEEPDSEVDFEMEATAEPAVVMNPKRPGNEEEEDSEEDEDDWEEVEELKEPLGPVEPPEPVLPSQTVEIEIETPEVRKKKKKHAEFETYLRRMMNRYKKDVLVNLHKVHLMCLIASGMSRHRLCSEPDLLAITLFLLPTHFTLVSKERINQNYLSGLLKWFGATFTINPSLPCEERPDPRALIERRLASLSARNHQEMTHLFLLVLRSLQLFCRLVLSLQPVPLKLHPAKGKGAAGAPGKSTTDQKTPKTSAPEPKVSPGTKRPAAGRKTNVERGGKRAKRTELKEEVKETALAPGGQKPKNLKRRSVASKVSYKESSSEVENEEAGLSDEDFQVASEDEYSADSESGAKSSNDRNKKAKSEPNVNKCKNATTPMRRSGGGKKQVKQEEEEGDGNEGKGSMSHVLKHRSRKKKQGPGADEWLEVYIEKDSSWICVDVEHGVGLPSLCSQNATAPVTYVVSVDGDGFLKDLGRKYDPTWMTLSRKRRVDEEWWQEMLEPFLGPKDEKDVKEDKELQNKLVNKPLPVSVAEYKNHPLYALKRHLLKYEAVYPRTATALGYCRGEPVYSRDCVHTLHSKDTWLKEARTVRLGEEPYKMVKGFSNRSRKARMMSELQNENELPLFGEWQTEEYQPPIAVDGKVPRNDYGNVYLFKPCMLPVGCVYLRLPNLHRVAKKLDIDAASAVTGFDFHGGYSHAVTDGYIVCEEHEEILRAAWVEEQELQRQKEKEKREKRANSNWTLLVKGLLIREKLKQRYGKKNQGLSSLAMGQEADMLSSDEEADEGGSHGAKTASETLAMSWPQNRQAEEEDGRTGGLRKKRAKQEKRGQEKNLFPFEKV
ncbi:DNA repair protein complementing XP-C cells [Brachionichthys hirsutus]|uniref:DNA repair protein complementing XP-C cells n=1 Tax=Brachionichthys hirsutus TaxID=412623 RepID=UPI00360510F5